MFDSFQLNRSKPFSIKVDLTSGSYFHRFPASDQALISSYLANKKELSSSSPLITATLQIDQNGVHAYLHELKKPFNLSYIQGDIGRRAQQGKEALCKVTGASRGEVITIIDGTAGLCREAYLMSSCGAKVIAYERCLPIYLLAKYAILESTAPINLQFTNTMDVKHILADVVYLDPMFPKTKKNAAVGKEAMVLRGFAEQDQGLDEQELLNWALDHAECRVVVKRPLKASPLALQTPTSSVRGKAIRFDIYGKKKLPKRQINQLN